MRLSSMLGRQFLKRTPARRFTGPGRVQALLRLPTLLRLTYALLRDERVPLWMRIGVLGLLALVFSPLDVIGDIPVVGQFWDFTVAIVIIEWFFRFAPAHVVNEHIVRLNLEKKIPLRQI